MTTATRYDFACGDVMDGCAATFQGTHDEVLQQVATHARRDHGLSEVGPAVVSAVEAHMQPAA